MKIIYDDKLIHADSASDVIQHFGIKGMKWGSRKNGGISISKALSTVIRHPILTSRAKDRAMREYINARKQLHIDQIAVRRRNAKPYDPNVGKMDKSQKRDLKKLKKDFRESYGPRAHRNKMYKYVQEVKAAKKQYKADKKAARDTYVKSFYGE